MKKIYSLILIVIFVFAIFSVACQPKTQPKKPGDFFPLTKDSFWEYEGKGNEFASFERKIIFSEDKRAQFREDNGGTVMALVFEITDNAVIRTFSKAEAYGNESYLNHQPNDNTIIIQGPIEVGTKWELEDGKREITDLKATVKTPAGKFDHCLVITSTYGDSTVTDYYKESIGLIKREFKSNQIEVSSSLQKYKIGK